MSDQTNDEMLDQNLARLLTSESERPVLSKDAEATTLEKLRAKQAEIISNKEKPMDHAVTPAERKSLVVPVVAVVVVACLILIAMFFAPRAEKPSDKGPVPGELGPLTKLPAPEVFEADDVTRTELRDGTVVIAHRGSKYSSDAPRQMTLERGDVYLIVAKSDQPFVVNTRNGKVTATGTRFLVSTGEKKTTASVAQGRVKLAGEAGQVVLRAGEQGALQRDKPPTRVPAPRLSYLVSWAKEALAQEELLVEKADAENGLIALDPWGQETRLTLRKYHVDVHIEDGIARTTIDQTFFNHYPWNIEGTFYFPLPPDASVSRLAMYVNGKLNEGGMVERGRGQQIYNDILYQRRDPALLEMMEGNVFKMRIFPLEGRQEKRIFLSYTQKLEELYSTQRYWFPMDHTHSTANQLSIQVRVKNGANSYDPRSSTHKLAAQIDGDDLVLTYDDEKVKPDQDFLLHLIPSKQADAARIATCEKDGFKYVFGRFTPEIPGKFAAKPRQWIVLNDVSASRSEIEAKAQRYILKRLVEEADDEDSVFLIDLNTRAHFVSKEFVAVRSDDAKKLLEHRAAVHVGGTNIAAGIEAAAQIIQQQKADNAHILYLGDGVATDGKTEVFSLVRAIPRTATFVGIGVGKKVDSLFLQSAADGTGGYFATINPDEDIDWRAFDLIAALNTPRLTKARVKVVNSAGKEMVGKSAIAYPSSRSLSDGETLTVVARCTNELPAKIVLEGRVGAKAYQFESTLDGRKVDAEFIPRLWAKRHIDELLKSDMGRKNEIIELSKHYYVVTPFTSLIVLEDDKMYEEYKVERGRKDHWALYPAPKQIEVVKEPVDWSRWDWWGGRQGEDEKIKAAAKPKSVREIVESVQFRINAPFYFWKPQHNGQERSSLYAMLDNKADPTRMLTYWYLVASGQGEIAARIRVGQAGSDGSDGSVQLLNYPPVADEPMRTPIFVASAGEMMPFAMMPTATSEPMPPSMLYADGYDDLMELPPLAAIIDEDVLSIGNSSGGLFLAHPMMFQSREGEELAQLPMLLREDNKRLAPSMILSHQPFAFEGASALSGVSPDLMHSLQRELGRRWTRINRDIRDFNRRYGYWNDWGHWRGWNSIDLTRSDNARWYGGLEGLLTDGRGEGVQLAFVPQIGQAISGRRLPPLMLNTGQKDGQEGTPKRVAWISVYGDSLKSQPGTCSVLAADHLLKRRDELLEKLLTPEGKQELEAINQALANIEKASARLEDSGPFWGQQGWNYQPQPWTFQQPQVQVYHNYNWSYDVTRYTPALYSNSSDILNEVVGQYGMKTEGKVSDRARRLISAARARIKAVKVRYAENGPEVLVAAGDRFAMTRRTDMYLKERMVCDGENILHFYDELGLASRRGATELRLSALRRFAPHLIGPADSFAASFDVDVTAELKGGFELRLTPLVQPDDEKQQFHLTLFIGYDGRIHYKSLTVGGEKQLMLAYQAADNKITARWFGKDDKKLAEFTYSAEPLENVADVFAADTSESVVFDMPLRKPSYYEEQLKSVDEKDVSERTRLLRHRALALVQQLHWRRWGGTNQEARKSLSEVLALLKKADQPARIGDLTLLGSAGVHNAPAEFKKHSAIDESHPVYRFYQMRNSNWSKAHELVKEGEPDLLSHLACYQRCSIQYKDSQDYDYFVKTFPDSPLILAATFYASNWGQNQSAWDKLYENPKWRFLAIMMSAAKVAKREQGQRLASAFVKMYDELTEAGYDVPITKQIASQLRSNLAEKWKKITQAKLDRVKKADRIGPLLQFAEEAMSWGEGDVADEAIAAARKLIHEKDSMLGRFAVAQVYWAGGRPKEALKLYDDVLATLDAKKIAASPALLASAARLAQQSGEPGRAIELEERALTLEHPHLPELVNLQAFRQRYNWLWRQYEAKIREAVNGGDDEAKTDWMARANSAWQRWREVDRENNGMAHDMATLQMTVGNKDDAWMYLSTVIDQRPRDATSYESVGNWYRGRNELNEAQQWFARAYEWDTANPRWLLERAKLLQEAGKRNEAREVYQKIIDGKWAQGLQWCVEQARKALNQ